MKPVKTILSAIAMIAGAAAAPALADEVWTTPYGDVYYETDLNNGQGVLRNDDEGMITRFYIDNLAGNATGRSTYTGFWVGLTPEGEQPVIACDVGLEDPISGKVSFDWGQLTLSFIDPDYPGRWIAFGGECFGEPEDMIFAEPKSGSQ